MALLVLLLSTFALLSWVVRPPPLDDARSPEPVYSRLDLQQLHETLVVRRTPDGRRFGDQHLDPLVWPDSDHLLRDDAFHRVLDSIDRWSAGVGTGRAVERALLQHDLWGLYDWLDDPQTERDADRRALMRTRIARLIRRLALSAGEIDSLPDNLRQATARGTSDSPADVPVDLFDPNGSWVQLAYEANGRVGTAHEENPATRGRSAFLLFVQPPPRERIELIGRINAWSRLEAAQDRETRRRLGDRSFPFPAGTRVALVRRMLVIDRDGVIRATPVTERIQLRELLTEAPLDLAPEIEPQAFALWTLDRRALVTGREAESLVSVGRSERGFELGPIQTPVTGDPFPDALPGFRPPTILMNTCTQCHKRHEFLSLSRDGFSHLGSRPAQLSVEVHRGFNAQATAQWKTSQPEFQRLLAEWEAPPDDPSLAGEKSP